MNKEYHVCGDAFTLTGETAEKGEVEELSALSLLTSQRKLKPHWLDGLYSYILIRKMFFFFLYLYYLQFFSLLWGWHGCGCWWGKRRVCVFHHIIIVLMSFSQFQYFLWNAQLFGYFAVHQRRACCWICLLGPRVSIPGVLQSTEASRLDSNCTEVLSKFMLSSVVVR